MSTTYLSRPVFDFTINWASRPDQPFDYKLPEISAGFAAPRFAPTQSHVVQGFEFGLELETEAKIAAFETFADALKGRLAGFWLPAPTAAARIIAGVSATQFDIAEQNLRDTWQDHPSQYLAFYKDGVGWSFAKITAVVLSGLNERITIDASLSIDETFTVSRLLYVRFEDSDERWEFRGEGAQRRGIKVEELPLEYSAVANGTIACWLYHFWQDLGDGDEVHWRYASFDVDLSDGTNTFTSHPISHGSMRQTLRADREDLAIDSLLEVGAPFADFVPFRLGANVNVEIHEATFTAPGTATGKVLRYSGRVDRVKPKGKRAQVTCISWTDLLDKKAPRMIIGPRCNYTLYSVPCGVVKATYLGTGTIAQGTPANTVTISGLAATLNKYAGGYLTTGTGANKQRRTIVANTAQASGSFTATLNFPLRDFTNGQAVTLLPWCDQSWANCATYANTNRFGGHRNVPDQNLSLKAVENQGPSGNKK